MAGLLVLLAAIGVLAVIFIGMGQQMFLLMKSDSEKAKRRQLEAERLRPRAVGNVAENTPPNDTTP